MRKMKIGSVMLLNVNDLKTSSGKTLRLKKKFTPFQCLELKTLAVFGL